MKTIRSDDPERLAEVLVLLDMVEEANAQEIRNQHIGRIRRLVEMLKDSVVEG